VLTPAGAHHPAVEVDIVRQQSLVGEEGSPDLTLGSGIETTPIEVARAAVPGQAQTDDGETLGIVTAPGLEVDGDEFRSGYCR